MRDMAVDRYLKSNRRFAESETYPDMTALYRALDHDEYDILYGINDSEYYDKQRSIIKNAAYKEINGKTLTIIYECPCKTTKKDNHHYNYNRPLEVVRLCRSCHTKEHYRLKLLADQSATNSTTPAVNAPAEDRGDCITRYLGITTSPASEYEIQSNDIHQHLPKDTGCFEPKGRTGQQSVSFTDLRGL